MELANALSMLEAPMGSCMWVASNTKVTNPLCISTQQLKLLRYLVYDKNNLI